MSQGVTKVRATSAPSGQDNARIEYLAAGAAMAIALLTWITAQESGNRAAIFICASLWLVLGAMATLRVALSGRQITKAISFIGVIFWFWIEATQLALSDPPFPVSFTVYPYLASDFPPSLVATGIVAVSLFGFSLIVGYNKTKSSGFVQRALLRRHDLVSGVWLDGVCVGLSILGWIPLLIIVGGDLSWLQDLLSAMRSYEWSGQEHDTGLAIHFGLLSVTGGALALARIISGAKGNRALQALAFLSAGTWIFASGSRFSLAYLSLPAVVALAVSMKTHGKGAARVLRWKMVAMAIVVGVAVILQGALRNLGFDDGSNYLEGQSAVSVGRLGGYGYDHFSAMLLAIDLTRRRGEYFMEPITPYFITHFIPRAWWPDKPYPESWLTYNDVVTGGAETFNVTPSVIGQYYLNWGLLGVAYIGLFFGAFARKLDGCFEVLRTESQFTAVVLCGMWAVFLFLSFRFFYPLYITFPIVITLIYPVLSTTRVTSRI